MAKVERPNSAQKPLIWERPEPLARPAPGPLSREAIVRAALQLAQEEGIDAVSLRNIARELEVGPMRLYGHIESKQELLDLLIDHVYGSVLEDGPLARGWRAALTDVASRLRKAGRAHPWFPALLAGRPPVGPHALAYMEAALSALTRSRAALPIDVAVDALRVLQAYVLGAVQMQANDLRAARETGLEDAEWRERHGPYLERTFAGGRFPTLQRVMREHEHDPRDAEFERGLSWVLDGIESNLRASRAR